MKRFWGIIGLVLLLALPVHATITNETTRASYTCNGVLTTFAYPFRILEDADLLAIRTVTATGAETTLALNTDYTVTGAGAVAGGNVVLTAASKCPSGSTITVMRDIGITQETDYVDGEAFSAASFEDALDKVTMVVQQQQDQLNRIPTLKKTSGTSAPTLADPVAGEYLRWNLTADGIESTAAVSSTGNFTQSGTGATERTVDAKIGEAVSVKDFGAVGDGSTNDTAAIQYALNTGKAIYFPYTANYYKITDTLNVTVAGTKIISDSGAKIVQATANKGVFVGTVSGIEIDGLELQGPWVVGATYETSASAIYAYGASHAARLTGIKVKNCKIHNFGWAGIKLQYVDRPETENNYVYDVRYAGIIGLMTNEPKSTNDRVNGVYGGSASGVAVGIAFAATTVDAEIPRYGTIASPTIMNVDYQAILLEPAQYFTISNPVIVDCKIGITEGQWNDGGSNYLVSKFNTITNPVIVNLTLDNSADEARTALLMGGPDSSHPNIGSTVNGGSVYGYGGSTGGVTYGAVDLRYSTGLSLNGTNIHNSYKAGLKIGRVKYSNIRANIYGIQATGGTAGILSATENDYTLIDGCTIESGALAAISIPTPDPLLVIGRTNVYVTTVAVPVNGTADKLKYTDTTAATTVTGDADGETGDLKSRAFEQNSIPNASVIRFEGAGTKGGEAGNKTINIVWGSTSITAHAAANNTNDWRITGTMVFTAANAQRISWACWDGATMTQGYDTASEDISAGDLTLKLEAVVAGNGDTVSHRLWVVEKTH